MDSTMHSLNQGNKVSMPSHFKQMMSYFRIIQTKIRNNNCFLNKIIQSSNSKEDILSQIKLSKLNKIRVTFLKPTVITLETKTSIRISKINLILTIITNPKTNRISEVQVINIHSKDNSSKIQLENNKAFLVSKVHKDDRLLTWKKEETIEYNNVELFCCFLLSTKHLFFTINNHNCKEHKKAKGGLNQGL